MYPEFSRAFGPINWLFQRALLDFQGLAAQGPFLFETLGGPSFTGVGSHIPTFCHFKFVVKIV